MREPAQGSESQAAATAAQSSGADSSRFGQDVIATADVLAAGGAAEDEPMSAVPVTPVTPASAFGLPFGASYCVDLLDNASLTNDEIVLMLRRRCREAGNRHPLLPVPPPMPPVAASTMQPATPPAPPVYSVDEGLAQLTAAAFVLAD